MLGLRLDPGLEARLANVARRHGRTKSDVARDAIRDFLARVDDDEALLAEVRRISAASTERDLALLDAAVDDLEELIDAEEADASANRAS